MADEKVVAAPDEGKASTGVKGADPEAVAVKASTANDDDPSVKRVEDEDSKAFVHEKEIHIGDERVHGPFKEEHVGFQDEHRGREVPADDPALHLEHDVTPAIDAVKKGGACVTGAQLMAPDERVNNNKLGALAGKDAGAGEEELVTKAEAAAGKVGGPIGMIGAASAIENPSGVKGPDTKAIAAKPSTAEDEKRADSEDQTIQDEHNKLGGAGKVVVEKALSGDKAGPSGNGTDDTAPPERGEQDGLDALGGMVSAHVTGAAYNTPEKQLKVAGAEQIPAAVADDSDHEDSDDEEDDDDDLALVLVLGYEDDDDLALPIDPGYEDDDDIVLEAPPPAAPARHFLLVVAGGAVALTAAILVSLFTNTDHGIVHPSADLLLPSGDLLLPPGPRGGTSTGVPLPALAPLPRASTPLPPPASSAPTAGDVFEFEGQRFGLDARGGTSTGVPPRGGGTSSPFRSLSIVAGTILVTIFVVLITGMVITGTIIMLIFALLLLYVWFLPWGTLLH